MWRLAIIVKLEILKIEKTIDKENINTNKKKLEHPQIRKRKRITINNTKKNTKKCIINSNCTKKQELINKKFKIKKNNFFLNNTSIQETTMIKYFLN